MTRRLAAAALGLLFALTAGCAPTCEEACSNVVEICADRFAADGIQYTVDACVSECDGGSEPCALDQRICIAEATSCSAIGDCPICP